MEKAVYHHTPYKEAVEFAHQADKKMLCGEVRDGEVVFDYDNLVMIHHGDGAILTYRSAFIRRYRDYLCVFTEHHGVHVYHQDDLESFGQFQKLKGPRPKLRGSGKRDTCDDCSQEFDVDDLEYGRHPDFERHEDFVALCPPCYSRAKEDDGDDGISPEPQE